VSFGWKCLSMNNPRIRLDPTNHLPPRFLSEKRSRCTEYNDCSWCPPIIPWLLAFFPADALIAEPVVWRLGSIGYQFLEPPHLIMLFSGINAHRCCLNVPEHTHNIIESETGTHHSCLLRISERGREWE
jgi:hypothetical protein